MLGRDLGAWHEGFDCAVHGGALDLCPYHVRSLRARSWVSGWIEGKAWRSRRVFRDGVVGV